MAEITIVETDQLPMVCAICGSEAVTKIPVWDDKPSILKTLFVTFIKTAFLGPLAGILLSEEFLDVRPIRVGVPVCAEHNDPSHVRQIRLKPLSGRRRVTITGISQELADAYKKEQQEKWSMIEDEIYAA